MHAIEALPSAIVIFGPTGVGKTSCVEVFARLKSVEIINMDTGSFYTPLTIGTAKPDWKNSPTVHHLFDIINSPGSYNVASYREAVKKIAYSIASRGKIPLLVGGSCFYLYSLFFPPRPLSQSSLMNEKREGQKSKPTLQESWKMLYSIDPVRANQLHPHDTYRIERALTIWNTTGRYPSQCRPYYDPVFSHTTFVYLTRERLELYQRINARVDQMIQKGWVDEAAELFKHPSWRSFILNKKIIGYDTLFSYLEGNNKGDFKEVIACIKQRTRNYAKRQKTYWRMLQKQLDAVTNQNVILHVDITTMTDHESAEYLLSKMCIKV